MRRVGPSRNRRHLALIVLTALAGMSAARPAASDEPAKREFVVALSGFKTMDPAYVTTQAEERVTLSCLEGLTVIDPATGQPAPGAAESWTTSPDGKTWTFKLRPAKWTKQYLNDKQVRVFEEKGTVKASDFVRAWLRLVDPINKSPHASLLDSIPDARIYANESRRGAALDRIATDFETLAGAGKRTIPGDELFNFVNDEDRQVRRWCGSVSEAAVQDLLKWPPNTPCQSVKYVKAIAALKAQASKSTAAADESRQHLGVDRGFYAKDDATLVVEVAGPSPWLPSLLARAPLVPGFKRNLSGQGNFNGYEFAGNGAYVNTTEFLTSKSENDEKPSTKVRLVKNPNWWRAASLTTTDVEMVVGPNDGDAGEAIRLFQLGQIHWVLASGLGPRRAQWVRDAKNPAWKAKVDPDRSMVKETPEVQKRLLEEKSAKETAKYRSLVGDSYEFSGSGVAFLRFRCVGPLEKPDVRRALAATVNRAALVKVASGPTPPAATRLVPARVTGSTASVTLPAFDAAKAKSWYGGKKLFEDQGFLLIACPSDDTAVADLLAKQWKAVLPDDASTWAGQDEDLRKRLDSGNWNAAIEVWQPRFDDPLALLSAFTSGNPVSGTNWSNATYDALIKAAFDVNGFVTTPDPALKDVAGIQGLVAAAKPGDAASLEALRRGILAEAEALLLSEAVVVPLWTTVESGLVSKKVRGLSFQGSGQRNILDLIPVVGASAGP